VLDECNGNDSIEDAGKKRLVKKGIRTSISWMRRCLCGLCHVVLVLWVKSGKAFSRERAADAEYWRKGTGWSHEVIINTNIPGK